MRKHYLESIFAPQSVAVLFDREASRGPFWPALVRFLLFLVDAFVT